MVFHKELVLKFSCVDQPGIIARVTSFFDGYGFNVEESSVYKDTDSGLFFMRALFSNPNADSCEDEDMTLKFSVLAKELMISYEIHDQNYKPRVLVAVSKWGHCLMNLLHDWKNNALPVDIVGVLSNHEDMRKITEWYGAPYHYLPIVNGDKPRQEAQIMELIKEHSVECLILARYMQVLSNPMCEALKGRAINIHHSFLPGFKGAKPYLQAYNRGVKLIGATAHYVTGDLDEGPIIEQAVERVSHANSAEHMVKIGRNVESIVLNRALRWYAEHRVLLNGSKTVVFRR